MSYQIFTASNREELAAALADDKWVVACLCAGWCGSCREYAVNFAAWAERSPQHHFVWIDIEDQADLVGDLDIDNFPTLLMQRGSTVGFFGAMEPDTRQAERLLQALSTKSRDELEREARSSAERREWQECDLQQRLNNLSDAG
ncbi:thioredoxin family protein [Herbaspirillum sp. RV1423]|uniref:thioredoxin family protein n=1 Tax=Herbaspirillum sp. RV1423 TaxID=1443993 RepID=UPI0004B634E9|nr:thioredoxin family protein [Herbaspirillum sp. RV1423]